MNKKKPIYVLGISCFYHDAAAAILKDGVVVAAAEEERFTRKKHDNSFPIHAIEYCLKSQNITINQVRYVGFYEKPFLKFERILSQHLETFPRSLKTFLQAMPSWINEKLCLPKLIRKKLKYDGEIFFIQHHLAHAASSFLVSPFKKAAILTVDGVGEWATTTYGIGEENDIHLIKEISFPSSIGLLYSTITTYLGFSANSGEYKAMGLSPYGEMDKTKNKYYEKLRQVIDIKDDGSYRLDMQYFIFHHKDRMPAKRLCKLLDGPIKKPEEEMTQRHKDIAAALQLITEEAMTAMLNYLHKVTKCENIVLGGGVALNSIYNGKVLRNTPFKKIWIQPNASDGGNSIGVAAYIYYTILKNKRDYVLKTAYLGPEYSSEYIQNFLEKNNISYTTCASEKELIQTTAKFIQNNNVIGWFQGRMEWGPRALGARSILSNATNPKMQEILNVKVKHREKFRPFAPAVCADDATKYFDCDKPIPEPTDFMLMVYPIKKEWHHVIPAVTHVDGSGRLQTIRREQNKKYYDLIKEVGKLVKVPIIINTSFNIRGEPIVCTPYDAYKCMMGTGIDYLIMDKYIIRREDNKKHKWDSEKYAKD